MGAATRSVGVFNNTNASDGMVVGGVGRQCQVEYDYEMWLDGYVSGGHCLQSAITFTSLLRVVVGDHHHLHLDNWMIVRYLLRIYFYLCTVPRVLDFMIIVMEDDTEELANCCEYVQFGASFETK